MSGRKRQQPKMFGVSNLMCRSLLLDGFTYICLAAFIVELSSILVQTQAVTFRNICGIATILMPTLLTHRSILVSLLPGTYQAMAPVRALVASGRELDRMLSISIGRLLGSLRRYSDLVLSQISQARNLFVCLSWFAIFIASSNIAESLVVSLEDIWASPTSQTSALLVSLIDQARSACLALIVSYRTMFGATISSHEAPTAQYLQVSTLLLGLFWVGTLYTFNSLFTGLIWPTACLSETLTSRARQVSQQAWLSLAGFSSRLKHVVSPITRVQNRISSMHFTCSPGFWMRSQISRAQDALCERCWLIVFAVLPPLVECCALCRSAIDARTQTLLGYSHELMRMYKQLSNIRGWTSRQGIRNSRVIVFAANKTHDISRAASAGLEALAQYLVLSGCLCRRAIIEVADLAITPCVFVTFGIIFLGYLGFVVITVVRFLESTLSVSWLRRLSVIPCA